MPLVLLIFFFAASLLSRASSLVCSFLQVFSISFDGCPYFFPLFSPWSLVVQDAFGRLPRFRPFLPDPHFLPALASVFVHPYPWFLLLHFCGFRDFGLLPRYLISPDSKFPRSVLLRWAPFFVRCCFFGRGLSVVALLTHFPAFPGAIVTRPQKRVWESCDVSICADDTFSSPPSSFIPHVS